MRLASREAKVVLDGQGADEQLAGYIAYQMPYIRGLLRRGRIFHALREVFGGVRHHRSFFSWAVRQSLIRTKRRELLRGDAPEILRYAWLDEVLAREITAKISPPAPLGDRNSMAFSIRSLRSSITVWSTCKPPARSEDPGRYHKARAPAAIRGWFRSSGAGWIRWVLLRPRRPG